MSRAETQTVYIKKGGTKKFHIRSDCPALKQANSHIKKERSVLFDDMEPCGRCVGDPDEPNGGWDTRREHGLEGRQFSVCMSCGGSKGRGQPCDWCERYEEVMGPYA